MLSLVVVLAIAYSVVVVAREREPDRGPLPHRILGEGTFEGHTWVYGMDSERCHGLWGDLSSGACAYFPSAQRRALSIYTTSGGHPSGVKTAQGYASPEVVSVLALGGGREVGEVHLFELPRSELRGVVGLVHERDVIDRNWVFVAYDENSREIARVVRTGAFSDPAGAPPPGRF